MLQILFKSGRRRAPRLLLVVLLVMALVSIVQTSDGPSAHVGSKEIQAAGFRSNVILHNQRDKSPGQHLKLHTGILGSSAQLPDVQHPSEIIRNRPEVHALALSPLTTTIITSSFL
jgi:hypothetical protein